MNLDIGQKIKALRKHNNMTLKDLSKKTNLSVGFLSQLERGLSTIAIDSLYTIAKVLGVDITYFITPPKRPNNKVVLKSYERTMAQVVHSKFIHYNLTDNIYNKAMLPRYIEILPMEKKENLTCYPHKGEEFVYVLEGILTLCIENNEYKLYPGDTAHYDSSISHNWANYTNRKVRIISVSTPNIFEEDNNPTA